MEEVGHDREAVIRELLVLVLYEAEWHFADERRPAAVGAPWAENAVAEREGVEVEHVARGFFTEAVAAAAIELADVEWLVGTDEEGHALVAVQLLDAQHELVELFQRVVVAPVVEGSVVAVANVNAYHQVTVFSHAGYHPFGLVGDFLLWAEDAFQFWLGLRQIAGVVHDEPALFETQKLENLVPPLIVRHFPRQSLVVVPPVAVLQVPLVVEREVDERRMEQVGEVFYGPVVEDDNHASVLGYASRNRSDVGPKSVARLSWCITNNSHFCFILFYCKDTDIV